MAVIIDRLLNSSGPSVDFGYDNYNYITFSNIYPMVITLIVLRLLQVNNVATVLISAIVLFITVYMNYESFKQKNLFLNDIMFEANFNPFDVKTYLPIDPEIIDFYYNNRWYINYNLSAYRKSLQATNNFLKIKYELTNKLLLYPEQNYRNAFIEYKEALNNLHSSIYKMTSHEMNNNIFNDNLKILKKLLKAHLNDIQKNVLKNNYNERDINIWSIVNPTNIEMENDTKAINYSPHYSFF